MVLKLNTRSAKKHWEIKGVCFLLKKCGFVYQNQIKEAILKR